MAISFTHGEIKRLLVKLGMSRKRKSGFIYEGVDKKGIYRRCKFDYHKDREQLRKGTANAIAKQLKFENSKEMRNFIDQM